MSEGKKISLESGFSLIEVIVVIALMGIISAVLIPQFSIIATRSKLKTDVESVKVLQHQIDIYSVANGEIPASNMQDIVSIMVKEEYFNETYLDMTHSTFILETHGASISFDPDSKRVKLKVTSELYNIYDNPENKSIWMVSS